MTLNAGALGMSMLMSEADRLAERAERELRDSRAHLAELEKQSSYSTHAMQERAEQAQRELMRLDLYRALLRSNRVARARAVAP
jgi:hypothetical protein